MNGGFFYIYINTLKKLSYVEKLHLLAMVISTADTPGNKRFIYSYQHKSFYLEHCILAYNLCSVHVA